MPNLETFRLSFDRAVGSLKIVITMPAYNAEATLERTVADIPAGIADQLILVDDASPDNTASLARELGIDVHVHPENRGYGGNQKTCYTMALRDHADIVVMLHPDYQYEPKAVPLLIAPILAGDADMTFGSRFAGLGDPRAGGMPLARYFGNRITTVLENFMLGTRFSEMHSGMRAYTRQCLLSLPFLRYRDDFIFDSQLLIDAVTHGQRVVEVPIPTRYTHESSSIGIARSVSYVGGSLCYCAVRVWTHGRRRHRSPLGRRLTPVQGERGSSSEDSPLLRRSIAVIRGYFSAGRRLLVIGSLPSDARETAQAEGWALQGSSTTVDDQTEVGDRVDAVLVLDMDDAALENAGGLEGLRGLLDRDGLLALVAPAGRSGLTSRHDARTSVATLQMLNETLRDSGFQPVECVAVPRSRPQVALIVARPSFDAAGAT